MTINKQLSLCWEYGRRAFLARTTTAEWNKMTSFLAPSVLSSGLNNMACFPAYALQMCSSVMMKLYIVILPVCYTSHQPLAQTPLLYAYQGDCWQCLTSKSKNVSFVKCSCSASWANTFDSMLIISYVSWNNLLAIYNATNPFSHWWIQFLSKARQTSLRNEWVNM
jgi:hypothetical protein